MPTFSSSNPAVGRPENEFNKTRRFYYTRKSRSPTTHVITTPNASASKIKNIFCPMHGEEAVFDRLSKHAYIYKCCAMVVPNELLGIELQDDGIMTVDGRTTRSPLYNRTGNSGIINIPANKSRSKSMKKMPLSPDDQQLVKQGYSLIHVKEEVGPPRMLTPIDNETVDLGKYDILDKFKRQRGLK